MIRNNPDPVDKHERELLACVHCGFCLSSCPTYLETGSEADSPRGRIVLMRALHDGAADAGDADLRRHIDLCLGCRACEPACPSGVAYGSLIEHARKEINAKRPAAQRLARRGLLESLTDPVRMKASIAAGHLTGGAVPKPVLQLLQGDPGDAPAEQPLPKISPSAPLPALIPAIGKRRARVGMLAGCVMRVLFGDVNRDTAEVLAANGCEVVVNQRQGCCGALHLHNGFNEQGKALARGLIDAFGPIDGLDAIVVNSAGCGSTMKEYAAVLEDEPAYAEKAARFAAKCKDVSEFLDTLGWSAPMRPLNITAAYHDACHLAQAQRITQPPRRILANIPQLTLVDLPESEVCCGSAGIYNLTEPEMARRLQARKVENILGTGASVVATGNPGCLSWIASGLARRDAAVEVLHPATLLRRALDADRNGTNLA